MADLGAVPVIYAEAAFFDRVPVAHCAARDEAERLARLDRIGRQLARAGARQRVQPLAGAGRS